MTTTPPAAQPGLPAAPELGTPRRGATAPAAAPGPPPAAAPPLPGAQALVVSSPGLVALEQQGRPAPGRVRC